MRHNIEKSISCEVSQEFPIIVWQLGKKVTIVDLRINETLQIPIYRGDRNRGAKVSIYF